MDYKYKAKITQIITLLIICCFVFYYGCSNKVKSKTANTFYVEIIDCNFDSLKQNLNKGISGKCSFYKNNQLQILSINYITGNLPEMHYFNSIDLLKNNIVEGTKKIQIGFKNPLSYDSVKYSMQKYIYTNKQWAKISDMGIVKTVSILVQPVNKLNELTEGIVTNIVQYSY